MPATVTGGAPARQRTLRAQGRKTVTRLLEAALEVFDKRGYHAARVDDICEAAGTSHGTFYLYFASKEDLFGVLVDQVTEATMELSAALPPISAGAAGLAVLRRFLADFYAIYLHYHPVIRAWMETDVRDLDLARIGSGVLGGFAESLVGRVREIEPLPVDDPEMAALAMVAMVERLSYYSVMNVVPVDREEMLDTMAGILHVGLFGGVRKRRR